MPARKPFVVKEAEGNRGKRRLVPPVVASSINFGSPVKLPAAAKKEWRRIRNEASWIKASDAGILAVRCLAWADWLQLTADVRKEGYLIPGRAGANVKNPKIQFAREARATVIQCDTQLGLTAMSRERITQEPRVEADPIDEAMFA